MSEKLIKPYILGIGGTTRAGSTSEKALRISLEIAQEMGARIQLVAGLDLDFPMYSPHLQDRSDKAMFLIELPTTEKISNFYEILDYFAADNVTPIYGLVHNPELKAPQITVSLLYSRKPRELVEDFKKVSDLV